MKQITLKVGQKRRIKFSFFTGINAVYCGMLNDKTFSIGLRTQTGNQGYGLNLFFPSNSSTIDIKDLKFNVIKVTPNELILEQLEN